MMMFDEKRETTLPGNERIDLMSKSERAELLHMIDFAKRHRRLHEQLYQLAKHGPCFDGDVISKSYRGDLLDVGACAKVLVKGEDGYNACTYGGRELLKVFNWLYGSLGTLS